LIIDQKKQEEDGENLAAGCESGEIANEQFTCSSKYGNAPTEPSNARLNKENVEGWAPNMEKKYSKEEWL